MDNSKKFNAYRSNFGGRGWFLVIFSLVTHYLVTASVNTMNVTAGAFSGAHGWSTTALYSFQTIAGWVAVFTMFLSGYLAQKYSPKLVSLISLIVFGLAFFFWGHVNALWQFLLVLIILQVFGSAASYNGNSVLIANWFPRKRGLAIGWATIGMPLAAATGIILTQNLLAKGGLTLPYYVFGGATFIIVILGFIFLRDYPEQAGCFPDNDRSMTSEQAKAMMQQGIEESKNSIWTPKKCFSTKEVWIIGISLGLMFLFANGVMGQFIPKALSMGFDLNLAIAMMSVAGISACFGSYLCGLVDAKVGPRKAAIYTHIIAAIAMILSIIPTVPTLIIGTVVIGIVMGGSSNYLVSMCVAMWGRYDFPRVYKILAPLSQFVGVGGSALVALLAEAGGGQYTLAYIVMAALGIVGAVMLFFIKDQLPGQPVLAAAGPAGGIPADVPTDAPADVPADVAEAADKAVDAAEDAAKAVAEDAVGAAEEVKAAVEDTVEKAEDAMKETVDAAEDAVGEVADAAGDAVDAAKDAVTDAAEAVDTAYLEQNES